MEASQFWQNFELGKEIEIACGFTYDGLRNLHEMETLTYEAEIFGVLYNISVGLERLIKVAVILIEYNDNTDSSVFEKSLITHNHLDLFNRVKKHHKISFGKVHIELLSLLGDFYKTCRYDRYSIDSVFDLSKEKKSLLSFLKKYLNIEIEEKYPFGVVMNEWRVKVFIGKTVGKIIEEIYKIIKSATSDKNIYTHEIRYYTKAYKLIYGKQYNFEEESVLWKELLIFLINTKEESSYLKFMKNIEPLGFDIGLISNYLQSFESNIKKIQVTEELESLYEDIEKKHDRLQMINLIGDSGVYFDDLED
ncbi:MAG: hypothetical protein PHD01_08625 [Geobacteraceae bacterium]|nr:hypothetical protein [Geobacteraceae bacterium]